MLRKNEIVVINTEQYLFDSSTDTIRYTTALKLLGRTELQVDKGGHYMLTSMSIAMGLETSSTGALLTSSQMNLDSTVKL